MNPCTRPTAPIPITKYGPDIGQAYAKARTLNPSHRFNWPTREGISLYHVALSSLRVMTDSHCAYCDGYPITATGIDQIDHFKPKTWEEFYELVCAWDNLFLACSACNSAKKNQWDGALLRPDELGFSFSRFFIYRTDTGELNPNPAGSTFDQHRARRTIEIFELNRNGACILRRNVVKQVLTATNDEDLADLAYRYLIPFCLGG